jgi:hypothetical protein
MKKKVLIKEGELDNLVVNILKEINSPQSQMDSEQLSFDFDDEEQYKNICREIPCDIFFCCLGTTLIKAKSFQMRLLKV